MHDTIALHLEAPVIDNNAVREMVSGWYGRVPPRAKAWALAGSGILLATSFFMDGSKSADNPPAPGNIVFSIGATCASGTAMMQYITSGNQVDFWCKDRSGREVLVAGVTVFEPGFTPNAGDYTELVSARMPLRPDGQNPDIHILHNGLHRIVLADTGRVNYEELLLTS